MKKIFLILTSFLFLLIFLFLIFSLFFSQTFLISNSSFFPIFDRGNFNLLLLGMPGPGYIGSENTDSLIVLNYHQDTNQFFLIPLPRDLIVKDEKGNLEKINALYGKKKINLLLEKASQFSGLPLKNYFAFDLILAMKLVDFLGGLEVYLQEPVTDPITLYTISSGKQKLDGYLVELVLRSRYNREGDFFRIKNQIAVLKALKEKVLSLNTKEKLELLKFLEKNKYHWQTNLSKNEILALLAKIKNPSSLKITPIIIDLHSGLLTQSYFKIYESENVYGIYPTSGVDDFHYLRNFIKSVISKSIKE